ncbi:hypothetical protein [Rhizobium sp. S163]|uniref:hypothetical protein n=1 Tax=Rhizobium sp. S163 TaxID=3055039 RepID=UPI000DBA9E1E|nr:hypothetical protein [Rhizobium sp. S163]MDM9644816.1 hypothetical protein [Rhizobium sp. S163]
MRMRLAAASILAFGMMTSMTYAQSNPTPNSMSGDKTQGQDAGGGANGDLQNQTGTNQPAVVDPGATNSTMGTNSNTTGTVDRTKCPDRAAPGAVDTQGGNSGASVSDACPDNSQ